MALIDGLLNLFRVETQVRALRSRLETAQRYLQTQNRLLAELASQIEETGSRQRQAKASLHNLEIEIQSLDERLEKYRNDLNTSANSKQYTAVLTELNTVKAKRADLENRSLQEMERSETLDAELAALNAKLVERQKVQQLAQAQLDERQAEVGQRLAELEAERSTARVSIPDRELTIFDEVADTYDGEAMAALMEIDRKHREYACGSCNMHSPFELVSQLINGNNTLARCSACGRILYMQEEIRGALARK